MFESLKQSRRPLFGILLAAFMLFGMTGCFEDFCVNVAWLPDSSGIIFTDKVGTQIVRYDLARKARKVVVQDPNMKTFQVAVSPDGMRCAFAKVESSILKDSDTSNLSYQVTTCDLGGQTLKQSSTHFKTTKLENKATEASHDTKSAFVAWTLGSEKMLISANEKYSMIYDWGNDKWTELGAVPAFILPNSGVRPDGKGFLTYQLTFATLDGWTSAFRPEFPDKHDGVKALSYEWDKNIMRIVSQEEVHEFDTESMTHISKRNTVQVLPGDGNVVWVYRFPKVDLQLCVFKKEEEGKAATWRLEAQSPTLRKRKIIITESERSLDDFIWHSYPSPDGTKIAILAVLNNKILIVDNTGEILDTITTQWNQDSRSR